ncbi:MAG: hypothetical protein KDH18_02525 [Rhodoferax sp.]|nr:hypothetical protein [Rhodoferax sp.]
MSTNGKFRSVRVRAELEVDGDLDHLSPDQRNASGVNEAMVAHTFSDEGASNCAMHEVHQIIPTDCLERFGLTMTDRSTGAKPEGADDFGRSELGYHYMGVKLLWRIR